MQRKCTCDHYSPPTRVLRSVDFNRELSQYLCDQAGSGDAIVDDVLTEIYDRRTGLLFGPDGKEIPIGPDADPTLLDDLFGEDPRRFINRYREKANRLLKNRLDRRCVMPVAILHLARQIKFCRMQGLCSR